MIILPPDPNLGNFEFTDDGTQLNVGDGGAVGFGFNANSGSAVEGSVVTALLS